jgi:hypothetical protein
MEAVATKLLAREETRRCMVYCPKCGGEYEGSPTHCAHCGLIFDETTVSAMAPRRRKAPRRRRIPFLLLGMLVAIFIAGGSAGLWFGGSCWERDKWQGRYETLETENRGLENEANQVLSDYDGIRKAVNERLGHVDRKLFITPLDESIGAEVDEIAGSLSGNVEEMWADYYRLYDWVVANVMYSFDSRLPILPDLPCNFTPELMLWKADYWRLPSETLAERTGDCEDMATLLASMILNYTGGKYECWVIMWTSGGGGHAAVAIPSAGGTLTVLDPVGQYATGLGRHLSVSLAVNEWLGNWPSVSGVYVSGVLSDTEGRVFASTDEFIQWATARMQ